MRLFFAIPLSDEIRTVLAQYQDDLRNAGVTGNFSATENLHLTLAFIGEYPDPESVMDAVSGISFDSFRLEIQETGLFSDTLWAGILKNDALENLVRDLRRSLSDSGIPFDRKKFRPHITLARKTLLHGKVSALPKPETSSMLVDSFSLFRSDRGKHGMIYTEIGQLCSEQPEQ